MNDMSLANDISKVILSTYRAPGVARHAVVLRHAVHDLETGHTSRALSALSHAGSTLNLAVFTELSKFLDKQSTQISTAVSSPAWAQMKSIVNARANRWQAMIESSDLTDLFKQVMAMRGRIQTPLTHVPPTKQVDTTKDRLASDSLPSVEATAHSPKRIPSLPSVEERRSSSRSSPSTQDAHRINYSAAIVTFVFTVFVAMLWVSFR